MISVIETAETKISRKFKTSDGKIFSKIELAEEHEDNLKIASDYNKNREDHEIITLYDDNHPIFSLLNIGHEIVYFNSKLDAEEYLDTDDSYIQYVKYSNENKVEYTHKLKWEGKGYYYFVVNCYPQTEDYGYYDDCDQTVVKTWRRFTDDMKDFIFELDSLRIRAVDAELSR